MRKRCRHCNRRIIESDRTVTGWIHGDPTGVAKMWQGERCPTRLTRAQPGPPVAWWRRIWEAR